MHFKVFKKKKPSVNFLNKVLKIKNNFTNVADQIFISSPTQHRLQNIWHVRSDNITSDKLQHSI